MQNGNEGGRSAAGSSFLKRVTGRLSSDNPPLGVVVTFADPTVTEVLCSAGYDFVWIDTEHTPLGRMEVSAHILAARSNCVAPFVRIPENSPAIAKPILDMGPAAVVFPQVNNAEEARRAVAACRYPPLGVRGFGPMRSNMYGRMDTAAYLEQSTQEPWVVVQIEHVDAVRNLPEICDVAGIGSLLVGPFDLSASIGKAGQTRGSEVRALMKEIASVAREKSVSFGAFALSSDPESIRMWKELGASWLTLDTDVSLLSGAARGALST